MRANEADVAYLLEAANFYWPDAKLVRDDVIAAWAGIRPLMPTSGSSVSASREHLIRSAPGSVRITGGKLTTYRIMATQAVDAAARLLGRTLPKSETGTRPLPAVGDELVYTIGDLLIRRTKVAFETRDNGRGEARVVCAQLGATLGWDASRQERELARYDAEVTRIFGVDP